MRNISLPQNVESRMKNRNLHFLKRVYSGDLSRYYRRLRALGFENFGRVLDAGAGFGQWSIILSDLNEEVYGIDIDAERISTAQAIAEFNKIGNLRLSVSALENLSFPNNFFDAIFCYSVIYHTNEKIVLKKFYEILKRGGLLYISFNCIGWYLYLLVGRGLIKQEKVSFKKACYAILGTMIGRKKGSHALAKKKVARMLEDRGFSIVDMKGDGKINVKSDDMFAFYNEKYFGLDGVIEILAKKIR